MPTTARKPRTCPDCGHRQYHHLNIVATCAVRCDRCKDDQLHVPLLHVQREQRIAATLARRGTPEWRAGGAHLLAERAQAEADRAHRRAEAAMQARLQAERDAPVADAELDKAVRECEAAVADAARDLGTTPEDCDVWHDVVVNQLANYRPALAAEVRRCLL